MARAPKAAIIEGAPIEPDLLDNAPAPRESTALFGHAGARAQLAEAFGAKPPQGLILSGARGIGKATLAFRLAKALISGAPLSEGLDSDPASRDVHQIVAGTHPSLLHLTRAWDDKTKRFKSELSVDTVRRLVPFLGATAAGGGWRIVIVDALDDMNPNAANALLKSLEEPPKRTLFLLIAHVAGRVMPTIRSRCQVVRMTPLGRADMAAALSHLDADSQLAAAADGSVRRALSLAAAGADAVKSAERLLSGDLNDTRRRAQIADLAATKRGEHFAVVADLTLDAFAARARRGAGKAPLGALDAYARAYLEALAERRRVEIFNLDRKEFILALTARMAEADALAKRS
ncbi:DNA polymerase III subunit delta' [Acuticoccus sp. MNP-M23]|uniref:DNA polymerase III subunit delta' n=1 Tax=Acuticoccus sp. MNP-M23 TaxID=3072793 RepID=UPI0028151398|nr:DNA polymerase III subunit delta' [Acuticoccus sp. MNP-M23]WMS42191.1 DNA polymerase III subunit delta' [Acuticoccus sp. MNP-M23]